jgi:hypothetical protein
MDGLGKGTASAVPQSAARILALASEVRSCLIAHADETACSLDIRPLLRMPAQIPASVVTGVWQQRMNTSLRLRRLKNKLRLATFLRYRIIRLNGDRPVGIPVRRHANPKHRKISAVNRSRQPSQRQHGNPKTTLHLTQLHDAITLSGRRPKDFLSAP